MRKKRVTGLDIGTNSIKMAEMEINPSGPVLTNIAVISTPKGSVERGVVIDYRKVGYAIRRGASKAGIKAKHVATAVSGQSVVVRQVTFPPMNDSDLEKAVKLEAERTLPFPMEEAILDYQISGPDEPRVSTQLEQGQGPGQNQIQVVLAAARETVIEAQVRAVRAAGLRVSAVDVKSLALARCLCFVESQSEHSERTATALVDIGAAGTDITIIEGEEIRFMRTVNIGGENNDEPAAVEDNGNRVDEGVDLPTGHSTILTPINELVTEVRRSLDYFQLQHQWQRSVSRIVLTGGNARLPGLVDLLETGLDIPAKVLNPLSYIQLDPQLKNNLGDRVEVVGPLMGVAIGLCLREVLE